MRLYEFNRAADSRLLTVLSFIRARALEKGSMKAFKTQSLINLVKNAGDQAFDYDALVNAYNSSDAVKQLIKKPTPDQFEFFSKHPEAVSAEVEISPEDTVDAMAKRALGRRD